MPGRKRIADPVHGTIELTELESSLINTAAFARLRGVTQLGLANFVFPGANYARLSHCIGVSHVARSVLDALERNGEVVSEADKALYPAAALLHDIGHYPFSHAMERAVQNYYQGDLLEGGDGGEGLDHERVGREVILNNPDVRGLLTDAGLDPEEVVAIIRHEHVAPKFVNLVSSDLDADRIDYLQRTAIHTGLPYGHIDLPYLLSQTRLDNDNTICFDVRALRAAEHLLLARYFDYQQVSFHKTVTALELLLERVLTSLLRNGLLDCSAKTIRSLIETPDWQNFDDAQVWNQIRTLAQMDDAPLLDRQQAASLINRNPPRLIGSMEVFAEKDAFSSDWPHIVNTVRAGGNGLVDAGLLDAEQLHLWKKTVSFTKIGAQVPTPALVGEEIDDIEDDYKQGVRILQPDGSSESLTNVTGSMAGLLGSTALFAVRLYAFLPDEAALARRQDITRTVADFVNDDRWLPGCQL